MARAKLSYECSPDGYDCISYVHNGKMTGHLFITPDDKLELVKHLLASIEPPEEDNEQSYQRHEAWACALAAVADFNRRVL